jgi:hypothetical protein
VKVKGKGGVRDESKEMAKEMAVQKDEFKTADTSTPVVNHRLMYVCVCACVRVCV